MEQVEGGDLIVNRGDESRPKDTGAEGRNLNTVEGYEAAFKLAQVCPCSGLTQTHTYILIQADIEELVKNNTKPTSPKPSSTQTPTTYSHVYLRIQPFFITRTHPVSSSTQPTTETSATAQHLQFLIYLSDPVHQLTHTTISQAVPGKWLDIWDEYEWVEDLVAEALRVGVEVVGQEYVVARMGWGGAAREAEAGLGQEIEKVEGETEES